MSLIIRLYFDRAPCFSRHVKRICQIFSPSKVQGGLAAVSHSPINSSPRLASHHDVPSRRKKNLQWRNHLYEPHLIRPLSHCHAELRQVLRCIGRCIIHQTAHETTARHSSLSTFQIRSSRHGNQSVFSTQSWQKPLICSDVLRCSPLL